MHIQFFAAGGTIDKVYFDAKSEYEVGPPQIEELLSEANVTLEFAVESLLRKDSLEMTDADRAMIRARIEAAACPRVVLTHGTDTMIDTARALLGIPGRTIVLTGSMQPAMFKVTDAVFNVGMAVAAAQTLPPGVYIAMNGKILDPMKSRKNRERRCFEGTGG